MLGERAANALNRNMTIPAQSRLTGASPLGTLTRLWRLQLDVPVDAVKDLLPMTALVDGGLLRVNGDRARALVDIRPYADDAGDWWVAADLTPGMDGRAASVPADHVLGLNAASSTLAQLTIRRPVARALDLGTGCGVQALHLARHSDVVIGTDVNARALAMASLTARLNGIDVDLRAGSLYEPVSGEWFDLIATNPPFVVSPGGSYIYRDSGLAGDEVSRRVVVEGAARLADGGVLQSLGNWMHVRGQDWQDRVGAWVEQTGCDAWVIQREVEDPAEYIELWLRDSGETGGAGYERRYRDWLEWFDANDVEGIGFGWIALRAAGSTDPTVRVEEWPHAVAQPLGEAMAGWFDGAAALRVDDDALLATKLTVADDVALEQIGRPGEADPEHLVLRQRAGLMRAAQADTAWAGFVGACDGTLPAAAVIDAVASVLELDALELRSTLVPKIRDWVLDGFLLPPSA
ncbi:methyltransferase [Phytoactinopolyspora alkaliphila]|uniref:Methyltransferase n=2 Tax=Phytoactinopolyspora alkaliphila TaxID=1783498 RepID=A0A6N9YLK3_9ACTN|nr:methyltransferase [Phytoactinopolyspora alkaliphila]